MGDAEADRHVGDGPADDMKSPRLLSAAAAAVLFAVVLSVATLYASRMETHWVNTLAPQMFAQKDRGVALQRAAFRQPDLLPMYGSSELNLRNPYHPSALFREYPTGFTVFPIGNFGTTNLIWLQALASVGRDLRGRKVVLSLLPGWFMDDAVDPHAYAANYSALQASELAFSMQLSFGVKQAAAQRMLTYPATMANDPLLRFALRCLANTSLSSHILYYAALPLGKLHNVALRLQDHWETLIFLHAQVGMSSVQRQRRDVDWTSLLSRAEQDAQRKSGGNPFGFENAFWTDHAPEIARRKGLYSSQVVLGKLERSAEWTDFDVLLRIVKELGGNPLILSMPMNGAYYDYLGIDRDTRRAYYDRLRDVAKAHGVPVIDFRDHDSDRFFATDTGFHPSDAGWTYYDRVLDAFFHGRPPDDTQSSELERDAPPGRS
jgi:D-alanine transfer protein